MASACFPVSYFRNTLCTAVNCAAVTNSVIRNERLSFLLNFENPSLPLLRLVHMFMFDNIKRNYLKSFLTVEIPFGWAAWLSLYYQKYY